MRRGHAANSPEDTAANLPEPRRYWRSLNELADTDEFRRFVHHEFPAGTLEQLDGPDRRHFLKIMGASMALAGMGLAGCRRWPVEEIRPYAARPEGMIPGETVQYATCREQSGIASSLLVTAYDNRPLKVEGNPDSSLNQGATTIHDQSSILDLYDPDRSRFVRYRATKEESVERSSWTDFVRWADPHFASLRERRNSKLAILSEASSSPSVQWMRNRIKEAFPQSMWYEYEPVSDVNVVAGLEMVLGGPHRPLHDLAKAEIIVSLDAELLVGTAAHLRQARGFAEGRSAVDQDGHPISRLHCFESSFSLTGANADDRSALRSSDIAVVTAAIAASVAGDGGPLATEAVNRLDRDVQRHVQQVTADLTAHRGASLVVAGDRQPAEVHALVAQINQALGNIGSTVVYRPVEGGSDGSLAELTAALRGGMVDTLVVLGGNPVFNAPADVDFAEALELALDAIHLSDYADETSQHSAIKWHINRAHYLETWGDARADDGTVLLCQPLIEPLFGGKSAIELMAVMLGDETRIGREIVRRTFRDMWGSDALERRWGRSLHDGFVADSATPNGATQIDAAAVQAAGRRLAEWCNGLDRGGMEVNFEPDAKVYDGRFANNGWLQEVPDPMTSLTWDNAALISPDRAEQLGIESEHYINIDVNGQSLRTPVVVLPGIDDDTIVLRLGYGGAAHNSSDEPVRIATDAGFNVYPLRTSDSMGFACGANVSRATGSYPLAMTQDHHPLNSVGGRGAQERIPTIVREAEVAEYREDPTFTKHRAHVPHSLSLFEEDKLEDGQYQWGMSVDLNSCIGCSACVVACQAENNIPIVGKEQVRMSREMHWLRIDRYFTFGSDGRGGWDKTRLQTVALQPMMCVHCENAPCEQVCPVAATVHDDEGLNVMIYNRCIGTRYCSNNCPYKVRRFNYFDWHRRAPHREKPGMLLQVDPSYYGKGQAAADPLEQMQFNPDVTVRMRGVMEKCTYCIQRIAKAKIDAKNEFVKQPRDQRGGRPVVPDGSLQTACQQACPTNAIVFGDLLDPNSRVNQLHRNPRAYKLLQELNTDPRTRYLAKIWNPSVEGSKVPRTGSGHGGSHNGSQSKRNGYGRGEGAARA